MNCSICKTLCIIPNGATICKEFNIESSWSPGMLIYEAKVNNKPIILQTQRKSIFNELLLNGISFRSIVMSRSKAPLQKLMPFKAPPDMSQFLLSPMPGLLTEIAVEIGQKVQVGQKLAVIEAMKMENVLIAQHEGVVSQIMASRGDSLSVDQIILRFNKD